MESQESSKLEDQLPEVHTNEQSCNLSSTVCLSIGCNAYELTKDCYTIGRGSVCDITIVGDRRLSRIHFSLLKLTPGRYWLVDGDPTGYQRSKNGIWINRQKVEGGRLLEDKDRIQAGSQTINYSIQIDTIAKLITLT